MNRFQESLAELRRAADRLIFSLLGYEKGTSEVLIVESRGRIGCFGSVYDGNKRPASGESQPIFKVVRSCITTHWPAPADLKSMSEILNGGLKELSAARTQAGLFFIPVRQSLLRSIAENALRYINVLAENPQLKSYEPIGVCARCSGIYMKRRTNQEYCSTACRSETWASGKGKQYFAEKARERRAAQKALGTAIREATDRNDPQCCSASTRPHRSGRRFPEVG